MKNNKNIIKKVLEFFASVKEDLEIINTKDGKVMLVEDEYGSTIVKYEDGTIVADGVYELDDEKSIEIKDGRIVQRIEVKELTQKEEGLEMKEEDKMKENVKAEDVPVDAPVVEDEKDKLISDLNKKILELENLLKEKEELYKKKEVEMSKMMTPKEDVKLSSSTSKYDDATERILKMIKK
jgi:hypothetical protein